MCMTKAVRVLYHSSVLHSLSKCQAKPVGFQSRLLRLIDAHICSKELMENGLVEQEVTEIKQLIYLVTNSLYKHSD